MIARIIAFCVLLATAIAENNVSFLQRLKSGAVQLKSHFTQGGSEKFLPFAFTDAKAKEYAKAEAQFGRRLQVNASLVKVQPSSIERLNLTTPARFSIEDAGAGTSSNLTFIFDGSDNRTALNLETYTWTEHQTNSWLNIEFPEYERPLGNGAEVMIKGNHFVRIFSLMPSDSYDLLIGPGYARYAFADLNRRRLQSSSFNDAFLPFESTSATQNLTTNANSKLYFLVNDRFMIITWKNYVVLGEPVTFQMIGFRGGAIAFHYDFSARMTSVQFRIGLRGGDREHVITKVDSTELAPPTIYLKPNYSQLEILDFLNYGINITQPLVVYSFDQGRYEAELPFDYPLICGQPYEGVFDVITMKGLSFQSSVININGSLHCDGDNSLGGYAISGIVVGSAAGVTAIGTGIYFLVITGAGAGAAAVAPVAAAAAEDEEREVEDDEVSEESEVNPEVEVENDWPLPEDDESFDAGMLDKALGIVEGDQFFEGALVDKEYEAML